MPSAANVKIDKQISAENNSGAAVESASTTSSATTNNNSTPLRQAITVIEHKIRNLEKRKAKLESYRELQRSGKDLNSDQKTAVAKYDEVIQTLDFAKELCKQFLGIAAVSEKEAKKLARKEALARSQSELAKIRDVLLVQDALTQMGQDNIREDFLLGRNGAAALTQPDLSLLDELYPAVTPKHEAGDPTAFTSQVQSAAEHLLAVVDGKTKEAFGGTYSQIKEVIGKIHESGYLDQAVESAVVYEETVVVESEVAPLPDVLNHEAMVAPPQHQHHQQQEVMQPPPIETLTIEAARPPVVPLEPPMEQQTLPPEQLYYQQQQQQQQQPPRPISEMLGGGSFYFLQDSELDTPETQQIPSQTFTNQSFVTGPPPPIPMPPHFQTFPPAQAVVGNNGIEPPHHPQELQHDKQQQQQRGRPRPIPMQQQQQQQQQVQGPPMYHPPPSNNGYNRPRQNRSGGRPNNNRQH